jgi:hypothetical protein
MRKPKKPTLAQEVQAMKITLQTMEREMMGFGPQLARNQIASTKLAEKIEALFDRSPVNWPVLEQFNQLGMAVNKIAAYAAAMDETKKTMIKLTSRRIDKLQQRVNKLRVRLTRLEG